MKYSDCKNHLILFGQGINKDVTNPLIIKPLNPIFNSNSPSKTVSCFINPD